MLRAHHPYYLANRPVFADSCLEVTDKSTQQVVCKVAKADTAAISAAIDAAVGASKAMAQMPAYSRQAVLRHCVKRFGERAEELADVLCTEAGKPITASRLEVQRLIDTFSLAADEVTRPQGEVLELQVTPRAQ